MLLFDAKKLWEEGGYAVNNIFEVSMERIRKYGTEKKVDSQIVDAILIDLFIELKNEPTKYITEGYVCSCGCSGTNSATNLIHCMFKKIDGVAISVQEAVNKSIVDQLNQKIINYMEKENDKYLKDYGPRDAKWYEMPTFAKWGKAAKRKVGL